MPFKSKAQMRLFFAKERRGELPEGKARQWAHETKDIKGLPEKVAFWRGFFKQADDGGMGDGAGSGFTGEGKGNILGSLEWDVYDGVKSKWDGKDDENVTDKTLLDRERNPRDFSPFSTGPALEDENGTKIVY